MQRRASKRLTSKDLLSFIVVAVLTVVVISILSALTRISALETAREAEQAVTQETAEKTLSAVIPKDNSQTYILIAAGLAALVIVITGTALTLKWIKRQKRTVSKRKYSPRAEVTFRNISRREMGVQKR